METDSKNIKFFYYKPHYGIKFDWKLDVKVYYTRTIHYFNKLMFSSLKKLQKLTLVFIIIKRFHYVDASLVKPCLS